MKIYISGPITNQPNDNREAFAAAAQQIREAGHEPVNPQELEHSHGKTWTEYMRADLKAMLDCDGVLLLDGWRGSRGATMERRLAGDLDIPADDSLEWLIKDIRR